MMMDLHTEDVLLDWFSFVFSVLSRIQCCCETGDGVDGSPFTPTYQSDKAFCTKFLIAAEGEACNGDFIMRLSSARSL